METIELYVQWFVRDVEEHEEKFTFLATTTISQFADTVIATVISANAESCRGFQLFWGKTCMNEFMDRRLDEFFTNNNRLLFKLPPTTKFINGEVKKCDNEDDDDHEWEDLEFQSKCRWERRLVANEEIYLVKKFLSIAECANLIKKSESLGYSAIDNDPRYRSNERVMIESEDLASSFFTRICALNNVPKTMTSHGSVWKLCGINPRFRFCRYNPGQHFEKHLDASFSHSTTIQSFFTLNVYLNNDFCGGHTRFFLFDEDPHLATDCATPKTGLALIFNHQTKSYLHDGWIVHSGTKYLLRTDIMYEEQPIELD